MNIINKIKLGFDHYLSFGNSFYFGRPAKKYNKLEPGIYTIEREQGGEIYLAGMSAMTDNLIRLPSFTSEEVIKEVEKFWQPETRAKFERRQIVYKRGVILHGKPGVGKSACVAQIIEAEVNRGGIVFFGPSPKMLQEAVQRIREIEGDIRCLVVWEEFDELLEQDEASFLSLLDGEMQIHNVVYLATTNYLKNIPDRFKNRPSRFATVIEIGLPDDETRRTYLSNKIFEDEGIDIEDWVKKTKGLTIDHIKDLIISVLCLDLPFKLALDRIKDFKYDVEKQSEKSRKNSIKRRLFENLYNDTERDNNEY